MSRYFDRYIILFLCLPLKTVVSRAVVHHFGWFLEITSSYIFLYFLFLSSFQIEKESASQLNKVIEGFGTFRNQKNIYRS